MAGAAEVPVLAGDPGQMVEARLRRETDEEVPVLEKRKAGIELADFIAEPALDHQRVERDVIVEEQQVGIEVAAVGQAPFHALPAATRGAAA